MHIRILLADDDDDDHLIFCDAIQKINPDIHCDIVLNGAQLLRELYNSTTLPDVIFIDINMPLLNGYECLAKIKDIPEFSAIPIVMFSTASNQSAIDTARILGASLFLSKPSDHLELLEKLKKVFDLLFPSQPAHTSAAHAMFYV